MSSIIKAEYVIISNQHIEKTEGYKKIESKLISTTKDDIYDIYNQREIILQEAREEAQKIINTAKRNAQSEIINSKNKGYDDGYSAGLEIGKNKGYDEGYEVGTVNAEEETRKRNELKINELNEMMLTVENEKEDIIEKYEKDLTKLAVDIAERILRNKIESKDNIVSKIIKDTIKDYRNAEWIKVYISGKDDVITIQADKTLIAELNKISKDVKIQVMAELDEGSAIIETSEGTVDAGIDTQLINLKEMVLNKNAI